MLRRALCVGITGRDSSYLSYLAELLLARGYEVHGLIRRASPAVTRAEGARMILGVQR